MDPTYSSGVTDTNHLTKDADYATGQGPWASASKITAEPRSLSAGTRTSLHFLDYDV